MLIQKEILLTGYNQGFHLITNIILKNLPELPANGLLNIFIKHTSAAIAINENADPSVRFDFNTFINKLVPFGNYFKHTLLMPLPCLLILDHILHRPRD